MPDGGFSSPGLICRQQDPPCIQTKLSDAYRVSVRSHLKNVPLNSRPKLVPESLLMLNIGLDATGTNKKQLLLMDQKRIVCVGLEMTQLEVNQCIPEISLIMIRIIHLNGIRKMILKDVIYAY